MLLACSENCTHCPRGGIVIDCAYSAVGYCMKRDQQLKSTCCLGITSVDTYFAYLASLHCIFRLWERATDRIS